MANLDLCSLDVSRVSYTEAIILLRCLQTIPVLLAEILWSILLPWDFLLVSSHVKHYVQGLGLTCCLDVNYYLTLLLVSCFTIINTMGNTYDISGWLDSANLIMRLLNSIRYIVYMAARNAHVFGRLWNKSNPALTWPTNM